MKSSIRCLSHTCTFKLKGIPHGQHQPRQLLHIGDERLEQIQLLLCQYDVHCNIFQISKAMKKTSIIFFLTTECHKFWETRRCIALMKCVKINKFMILHMSVCVLTWHKHKARNLILIIQGVWWSWVQLQAMAEPAWGSTRSSLTV